MAKIRISYSDPAELEKVKRLLHPIIKGCKVSKTDKGQYKKAYIETIEQREIINTNRRGTGGN